MQNAANPSPVAAFSEKNKNSDNASVTQKLQILQYSRFGDWNVITGDYGYTTNDIHQAIYNYAYNWIEAEAEIEGKNVKREIERIKQECLTTGRASGEDWVIWSEVQSS